MRFSRMRQGLSNCRTYSFWDSSSLRVAFQLAAALTCNSHVLDFLASAKLCRSQLCLKPSTSHCRERVGIISVALFITIPLPPLFENIENKGNSYNLLLANNMRISDLLQTRGIFITEGILMNNSTDKLTAVNCRSQTRHMSALPEVVTIFQYRSEEAKKSSLDSTFELILPQEGINCSGCSTSKVISCGDFFTSSGMAVTTLARVLIFSVVGSKT